MQDHEAPRSDDVAPVSLHPPSAPDIVIGGLLVVLGVVITVVTYQDASGGGTYIVAWGPVVYGAARLFRGLVNLAR